LFETVLNTTEEDLCLSTQWVYDITQEFVYQFQGFCQYRCQVANLASNAETIKLLEANRDAWNLPQVVSILRKLINAAKAANPTGKAVQFNAGASSAQFGYFAAIELSRLECLTGDFGASLSALTCKLSDRSELFVHLPLCHFNVFYHTGVCNLMLRRFPAALDVLSEIVSHVSRALKPGAAGTLRAGLQAQLQRQLDKAVALLAIASFLCPSHRLDDQVKETLDAKFADKLSKMQNPETYHKTVTDLFDFAAPKFISPAVPDYSVAVNTRHEVPNLIQAAFMTEVEQHQSFLKLRSFLGLYASIEVAKLARFNDTAEPELICQLLSLKNKSIQVRPVPHGAPAAATRVNTCDVHYFVEGGAIVTDSMASKSEVGKAHERYFLAGVRKHAEIANQIHRAFASAGLE
jgi:translation initiation factor 3 subunit L